MTRTIRFLQEVWEELGKVTWPTRTDAVKMTITVIIASIVIAAFIGGLDFFLTSFIGRILSL